MVVIVDFTTLPSLELLVTDRLVGHGVGFDLDAWHPSELYQLDVRESRM